MNTQPARDTQVSFDFRLPQVIGGRRRTGKGVVVGESVVGTDMSALVRVTESTDYPAGTIVDVRNRNLWPA